MKNVFASFLLLCSTHFCLGQGSLTPPGAPAPIMKTLSQVEPRTAITNSGAFVISPGSYYLTTNISVSSGAGVLIATNRVTLDLNGFTISSTAAGTGFGVEINGIRSDIVIFNGHITGGVTNSGGVFNGPGFGDGIGYSAGVPTNVRISGVTISGCRNNGISLGATHSSSVESCVVNTVGGTGIQAAIVSDCSASQCNTGISGDLVRNCYAQGLGGFGIAALTAENCFGAGSSSYGVFANTALNCYGQSASGGGVIATVAQNCYGTSSAGGVGVNANMAQNCYGTSVGYYGIYCDTASSCRGGSTSGTGIFASYSAFLCVGVSSAAVPGLSAYIAHSCYGAPSVNASFKYNMP